jgi:hypothetical protein
VTSTATGVSRAGAATFTPSLALYSSFASREARGAWGFAKQALAFAELCNDGDDEGAFILNRLPTESEAAIIRAKLGIAKKRQVTEAELERLRRHAVENAFKPQESLSPTAPLPPYPERVEREKCSGRRNRARNAK